MLHDRRPALSRSVRIQRAPQRLDREHALRRFRALSRLSRERVLSRPDRHSGAYICLHSRLSPCGCRFVQCVRIVVYYKSLARARLSSAEKSPPVDSSSGAAEMTLKFRRRGSRRISRAAASRPYSLPDPCLWDVGTRTEHTPVRMLAVRFFSAPTPGSCFCLAARARRALHCAEHDVRGAHGSGVLLYLGRILQLRQYSSSYGGMELLLRNFILI